MALHPIMKQALIGLALQTDAPGLSHEELDTIEAIARNGQTGRITSWEIRELVRVYRAAIAPSNQTENTND